MIVILISTILGAAGQQFLTEQFSTHTGMLSKLYMKCSNLGKIYNFQKGEM